MFKKLFPEHGDNTYGGHKLALWLFALLLLLKGAISVNSMLNGFTVATSADNIPLDTYSPAGAQAFVSLFALWGLSHFMIDLLGVLVLVRYRSLIPLMYLLFLLEHLARKALLHFDPIAKTGTSHGLVINIAILAVMVIGLALALWQPKPRTQSS